MQHCQMFSEHITVFRTLAVDIWQLNVNNDKQNKNKLCKLFKILKFFFLILLKEATLASKVAPTNRNSSTFQLHTTKTISNVDMFSICPQSFLELILVTNIKTMLLKQSAVLFTNCQKILPIYYAVWTLKILFTNKRIWTK